MKKSRFTETQIVAILKQADAGMPVKELCRKAGISEPTWSLRDELLDQHLFARLEDVREAVYWWMLEYNEDRPHDSLGDLTPVEYAQTARNSTLDLSP